jgi:radical SAM protein with 4Fe4S-binding SPASM domain
MVDLNLSSYIDSANSKAQNWNKLEEDRDEVLKYQAKLFKLNYVDYKYSLDYGSIQLIDATNAVVKHFESSDVVFEAYCMGNIETGIKTTAINQELTIYSSKSCSLCWARFVCGGECYHNAYETTGSVDTPLEYFCDLYRYLIELSIDLYPTTLSTHS